MVRIVDTGDVPIRRFVVVSGPAGKEYPMRAVRFGQTSSMTYLWTDPSGERFFTVTRFGRVMVSQDLALKRRRVRARGRA